jgi:virulence-associated protein VagC
MKTVLEAKVFKNGGSSAIRVPASFKLEPGDVVYIELNDDVDDFVVHRRKPKNLARFFELQETLGPISDDDWVFERKQTISKMRKSIQDLIE